MLVPVVLAKLWSVAPKLFAWPPVRSPAQALERLSLLLLVGGILFEIVTGLLNIQYDYVFGFSFYAAHYVGAWVFIGGFVAHVALKLPHMCARAAVAVACAPSCAPPSADTRPEEPDPTAWSLPSPAPPTMSRRGALALVGGGSLLVAALTAGQTLGGPLRGLAVLLPRGRNSAAADGGPNDFPVNKTFAVSGIEPGCLGATWRLDLTGGAALVRLDRDALAAQPAAHRDAADRLRRGLVDDPDLDRGAAARPRRAGRRARARERGGALAGERPVRAGDAHVRPGAAPGRAARAGRQRGAARAGPRLPGPGRRPGAARRAQHQVGPLDRVPELLMRHRFETLYGAGPRHLAVLLLSVAVAGYAASIVAGDPLWPWMAVWFVAVVVVHDGLLSPLAAVADAVLRFCLRWFPRVPARPTTVNYVRVPALGAALTFLMFLPGIIRQGEPVVVGQTGLDQSPFLGRWLLLVAAMAAVSALVYGVRQAHQTVSSRWLTASASPACAASHMRGAGQQRARHHEPHRER